MGVAAGDGSSEPWSSRAGDINQERALAPAVSTPTVVAGRDGAGFAVAERSGSEWRGAGWWPGDGVELSGFLDLLGTGRGSEGV